MNNDTFSKDRQAAIMKSLLLSKIMLDSQPRKILHSRHNYPSAEDVGLVFPTEQFILLKSCLIDTEPDTEQDPLKDPVRQMSYGELLILIENIFMSRLNSSETVCYATMMNEDICFLLCLRHPIDLCPENTNALLERVRELCEDGQRCLWEKYQLKLQIWGSDVFEGINRLHSEYIHLNREDLLPISFRPVMLPNDIAPYMEAPTGKPARQLQMLEQAVVTYAISHDFDKCEEAFLKVMELERSHYPVCNHIADRALERLATIYAVAGVPMNSLAHPEVNSDIWRKNLLDAVTDEDVIDIVREVLSVCREYFAPSAPPVCSRISEIVSFVDENLCNPRLCSDLICSKFNISPSYLSKIFKDYQGIKLIDYIHTHRVKMSKPLLLEDNPILTIQQVAESVGYTSALTFTRAFKRIEGMTPGSFRRVNDEENDYAQKKKLK
ncbi:MAG: helix-turn-helix transcriptional regulator [Oscillospiraceae bacterium]